MSRMNQPRGAAASRSAKPVPRNVVPVKGVKGPHEVRIIGGQWKRSKLSVASKPGLRPTPDRVRETLFNWLASASGGDGVNWADWQVIDAFAGTGALGFEAASRGAGRVTLVEQDAELVAMLNASKSKLKADAVNVVRGDGRNALARVPRGSAQLILLDPPFDADWYADAIRAAREALAPEGWLYVEAPRQWSDDDLAPLGLTVFRYLKAGAVHAHLLKPRDMEASA